MDEVICGMIEELTCEEILAEGAPNDYREASKVFLRIMNLALADITCSRAPTVKSWAVAYSLGLACCEGVSISDRAAQLGVSPQDLSKQIKEFQAMTGLPESPYMYKKGV